eukprot:519397-Prorocentrum_minimum.AAC.1
MLNVSSSTASTWRGRRTPPYRHHTPPYRHHTPPYRHHTPPHRHPRTSRRTKLVRGGRGGDRTPICGGCGALHVVPRVKPHTKTTDFCSGKRSFSCGRHHTLVFRGINVRVEPYLLHLAPL